jgi:hypothetical protein
LHNNIYGNYLLSDKSGVPVEARMVNIPAISIPMYGIRFKIPVISPNGIKVFDTNNIRVNTGQHRYDDHFDYKT